MKPLITLLLLIALALGAFGYWGVFTQSGRRQYDEMAGFIPGIALLVAAGLFVIVIILVLVGYYRKRKPGKNQ